MGEADLIHATIYENRDRFIRKLIFLVERSVTNSS